MPINSTAHIVGLIINSNTNLQKKKTEQNALHHMHLYLKFLIHTMVHRLCPKVESKIY